MLLNWPPTSLPNYWLYLYNSLLVLIQETEIHLKIPVKDLTKNPKPRWNLLVLNWFLLHTVLPYVRGTRLTIFSQARMTGGGGGHISIPKFEFDRTFLIFRLLVFVIAPPPLGIWKKSREFIAFFLTVNSSSERFIYDVLPNVVLKLLQNGNLIPYLMFLRDQHDIP